MVTFKLPILVSVSLMTLVGVPLIEHLVFTERAYFPIIANCVQGQEPAPLSKAAQHRKMLFQKKKER